MPTRPLKIAMVISSLSAGGAERVAVLLARGLAALGHRVSIVTVFGAEGDFYPVPEGVERVALDLGGTTRGLLAKIAANAWRKAALGEALGRIGPDAVISFMAETNVLTVLACLGTKVPVLVTEHADPRVFRLNLAWRMLRAAAYRRAACVVSVSPGVDDYFARLPERKRVVIPNPIPLDEIRSAKPATDAFAWPHTVIGMGRLAPEKGFDVLLRAFARSAARRPDWGLAILGEGPDRARLESLAAELGIEDRAGLPGVIDDPFPRLRAADLFVLSSRSESFAIALVEAMACGLPAIATRCWSRSPGLVRDGVDGVLVPPDDVDALSAAMAALMDDEPRRRQLAAPAAESVERFHPTAISHSWDELLEAVVRPGPF